MKVLRIPFEEANIGMPCDYDDLDHDLHEKFGDMFGWCGGAAGKFESSPTYRPFIDYVLEHEYGADCGEWGKVRELYQAEKLKYIEVFKRLNPNINMDKVKLVEYCWYNCSEAPDYYYPEEDSFYKEIPFICNFN
jgi:hypothetical protein